SGPADTLPGRSLAALSAALPDERAGEGAQGARGGVAPKAAPDLGRVDQLRGGTRGTPGAGDRAGAEASGSCRVARCRWGGYARMLSLPRGASQTAPDDERQ